MQRLFLVLLFSFLLPACQDRGNSSGAKSGNQTTIAVIPKGTTHEFWKSIHAGAMQASKELGVEVIWKGPVKEDDREDQIKVVEDFIARGVSGMVLAPLDNTALRKPVSDATRSGIPVVIVDSGLESQDFVSFVATDNYLGGQMAAEHLAGLLGEKGRVFMLRYQEGSASTMNREKGFLDAIKKFPDITVASHNQYAGSTTESAYQASENLLNSFKTSKGTLSIDGIFAPCEPVTFGMLRALQDGALAGTVKFVGFDSSKKLVEGLRSKEIHALVMQDPVKMGYLGVKTLVEHLQGNPIQSRIDTGITVVTPENMDQPEMHVLLEPELDKWLG